MQRLLHFNFSVPYTLPESHLRWQIDGECPPESLILTPLPRIQKTVGGREWCTRVGLSVNEVGVLLLG